MSGFKRASGAAKKSFSKKRASPSDDEDAARSNKKAKANEDEESTPFVPTLQEDDEGDAFVGVSSLRVPNWPQKGPRDVNQFANKKLS